MKIDEQARNRINGQKARMKIWRKAYFLYLAKGYSIEAALVKADLLMGEFQNRFSEY